MADFLEEVVKTGIKKSSKHASGSVLLGLSELDVVAYIKFADPLWLYLAPLLDPIGSFDAACSGFKKHLDIQNHFKWYNGLHNMKEMQRKIRNDAKRQLRVLCTNPLCSLTSELPLLLY